MKMNAKMPASSLAVLLALVLCAPLISGSDETAPAPLDSTNSASAYASINKYLILKLPHNENASDNLELVWKLLMQADPGHKYWVDWAQLFALNMVYEEQHCWSASLWLTRNFGASFDLFDLTQENIDEIKNKSTRVERIVIETALKHAKICSDTYEISMEKRQQLKLRDLFPAMAESFAKSLGLPLDKCYPGSSEAGTLAAAISKADKKAKMALRNGFKNLHSWVRKEAYKDPVVKFFILGGRFEKSLEGLTKKCTEYLTAVEDLVVFANLDTAVRIGNFESMDDRRRKDWLGCLFCKNYVQWGPKPPSEIEAASI